MNSWISGIAEISTSWWVADIKWIVHFLADYFIALSNFLGGQIDLNVL